MITKEQIKQDLIKVCELIGKIPSSREYQEFGTYNLTTVFNKFGSWNEARYIVFGGQKQTYRIPLEDIITDIHQVRNSLGKIPSKNEYLKLGQFSEQAITSKFGFWNKALKTIFGETNEDQHKAKLLVCEWCQKNCFQKPCQIRQNKHHFCSLSCSSSFAQKNKKYGTNKSKMEKYLANKLQDQYPNLDVIYNSKKAIGLELDIYIPVLAIAFEINGIFHYKSIFGQNKLQKTQFYDREKIRLCQESNIKLIVIDTSKSNIFNESHGESVFDFIASFLPSNLHKQPLPNISKKSN